MMFDQLELLFYWLATGVYALALLLFFQGWRQTSAPKLRFATMIVWAGLLLHAGLVGLRWYRAGHVPFLSAFEFVTFFAFLVVLAFLLFATRERNRALGVFLLPVALLLMLYAASLSRVIEPEIQIFSSVLLKIHVLTTLFGYAAWSIAVLRLEST